MSQRKNIVLGCLAGLVTLFIIVVALFGPGRDETIQSPSNDLEPRLHIFCWSQYFAPTTIGDFEKRYGVKVIVDNYASNEEMLAKLANGAGGYDLIFPSDYMVAVMTEKKMLMRLKAERLVNRRNVDKRFLKLPFDPDGQYSVPYAFGTLGVGFNTERVNREVDDWDILFDPRFKGRITVLDDMRFTFGFALKSLGYSVNTVDRAQLREARDLLIKQKPLLLAYDSDNYFKLLASGESWVGHGYSGDVLQAANDNKSVRYIVPKSGSVFWVDNMCVLKDAAHPNAAHAFINYILEPKVHAAVTTHRRYGCPNAESIKSHLDPAVLNDPQVYPPQEVLNRCEFLKDLGEGILIWEEMWNAVKNS